ncbi:MAG: sensor histidine kinase [Bacteroidota bacterium]
MKKYILTYFLLLFVSFNVFADLDKEAFLKKFKSVDYKEKVRMVANLDFNDLEIVYPQIKDTLDRIKKMVYTQTESNEAKFLLDIIDANVSVIEGRFAQCVSILNSALQYHCDNINDSLKGLVLLKECYLKISDYTKALEIHKIIEKNWSRKSIALGIGTAKSNIYGNIGIYKYAIAERIKEYESGSHDHWETARLHNDIGVFYNKMNKLDSAEFHFKLALKELEQIDKKTVDLSYYDFFQSLIKSNLAVGYIKNKKYKEAIPYLLIDVRNSLKNKEFESAFNAYLGLVEVFINLKNFSLAKKYLDTLDILDINEFRYPKNIAKKYYWQSVYYEKIGEINQALSYLKKYIKLSDSIREIEKELQTINTEIAFNVQQKDNALKEKNTALSILKIQQEKNNTVKTYLVIFIIILLIAGFILFKYYRDVQKHSEELEEQNQIIQQQNQIIQKSLQEKEMLIKEIHHRVKNNLQIINSIIRLQMSKENNEKLQLLLSEISTRIQSIALTHQMLYKKDSFLEINAPEYIQHLCKQIVNAFSDSNSIELKCNLPDQTHSLSLDIAIPLGLICSEVITNAIKYAFPNKRDTINVEFNCDETNCHLIIRDNGIGIDLEKTKKSDSLGMELIKLLSEQIEAEYSFRNENGTVFELKFKK